MTLKKTARKLIFGIFALVAFASVAIIIAVRGLDNFAEQPSSLTEVTRVHIPKGSSLKYIADRLHEKNIVQNVKKFYWYARWRAGVADKLQAGYFSFQPHMSAAQIIEHLRFGREEVVSICIPEGTNKEGIGALLAAHGVHSLEEIEKSLNDIELAQEFGVPELGAGGQASIPGGIEGYLFPDTYLFPKSLALKEILRHMHQQLITQLPKGTEQRLQELHFNLHQILTLASLIEVEAATPQERPIISGVFYNRLKKRMKLQTDPTVAYGEKNFNGKITKELLTKKHAYNTYVNSGLPPGPIASPGLDSIRAALWPTRHDFLYFVSKNDGTHEFCKTLVCHNKAVGRLKLAVKKQRKSSARVSVR